MLTQTELLFGLGLPALVGAVLFLMASAKPIDAATRSEHARDASLFALALGYLAGQIAIHGQPAVPPSEATHWLWLALAGLTLLSAGYECFAGSRWPFYQPLAIGGLLLPALWLIVQPLAENAWSTRETALWGCGLALATVAVCAGLAGLLRRRPTIFSSTGLVLSMAGAAIVLLMSGTKTYAQLAAAATAALVPGILLVLGRRAAPFSPTVVPAFVLVLGGLLLAGHLYASLTPLNALLLLCAPLGLWLGELPALARRPGWQRGLVALAATLVPIVLAVGLATRKFLDDMASGY